jgi:hypothetical protein
LRVGHVHIHETMVLLDVESPEAMGDVASFRQSLRNGRHPTRTLAPRSIESSTPSVSTAVRLAAMVSPARDLRRKDRHSLIFGRHGGGSGFLHRHRERSGKRSAAARAARSCPPSRLACKMRCPSRGCRLLLYKCPEIRKVPPCDRRFGVEHLRCASPHAPMESTPAGHASPRRAAGRHQVGKVRSRDRPKVRRRSGRRFVPAATVRSR